MEKEAEQNETKPFKDVEWKSLKTSFFIILLILFIFFTFILITGIVKGNFIPTLSAPSTNNLYYNFNNDVLYTSQDNNESVNFLHTWNLKNRTVNTNNYTAHFNFTSDTIGSEPSQLHVYNTGGTGTIQNIFGFNHAFVLNDTIPANRIEAINQIPNITYGIIEFWLYTNDTSERSFIRMANSYKGISNQTEMRLRIENGNLEYYTGVGWTDTTLNVMDTVWNHFKIYFTEAGSHYGLTPYYIKVQLNGLNCSEFPTILGEPEIDLVWFRTYTANTNDYFFAIDNMDYSWIPSYSEGRNLYPYSYQTINNRILDTKAYEFCFEAINNLHDTGDDNPYGFTENDGVGDNVNIKTDFLDTFDSVVHIGASSTDTFGIYKEFNNLNGYIYNITVDISINNTGTEFYIEVLSNDSTSYLQLLFIENSHMKLQFYDGSSNVDIIDGLSHNTPYRINMYINNYHANCIVRVKEIGGSLFGVFDIPFYASGKNGIGRINIYNDNTIPDVSAIDIDSVGIFENGISKNNDFAFTTIPLDTQNWNRHKWYLENIKASGYFTQYHFYKQGLDNESYYDNTGSIFFDNVVKNHLYTNITQFINLYSSSEIGYTELVFFITNDSFSCTYLNIDGVILEQDTHDYVMTFDYNEINPNESYFYVNNSKLRFNYEANDNAKLEYIQASFTILEIAGINRSCRFISQYNGSNYGYFYTNYTDNEVSLFYLYPYTTTQALLISPYKTIDGFSILITDNNENYLLNASGYVSDIILYYIPNYFTSVSTFNIFTILAPLIVLVVPTLLISIRLGKIAILPMLLLMTIVCFIGSMIPNWLFFILVLAEGVLFILQQKFKD